MNIARMIRRKFNVRVTGTVPPIPSRKGTRLMLADLWNELGYMKGVEVGVYQAGFSLELLNRIPALHLTCVDPWLPYLGSKLTDLQQNRHLRLSKQRLHPFVEAGRASIMQMTSMEAVKSFADNSLDFAFIDGDHSFDACMLDMICWTRVVRPGGMIAVHDYIPMRRSGVMQAVDAYTKAHQVFPWYVTREELATAFWVQV